MMFKPLTPRLRQIPPRKSAVLSILDVGASKIVCLIARLTPIERSHASRGRTHRDALIFWRIYQSAKANRLKPILQIPIVRRKSRR